jgi:WXG100 family type VII secretion target
MPNLNVTYQDMKDAAGKLRAGQTDIETDLGNLKRMIDALVSGGYVTDQSSKQFQTSYEEFNTGVTKTLEGLEGMAMYLDKAAEAFQQADQQLASSLQQ